MSRNHYVSGQHNVTCDICSQKTKSGLTKQRWDGFRVCHNCFEERHPQDFVRARQDKISVPFSRPIPTFVFTNIVYPLYVDDGYYANPLNQQYIIESI